MKWFIVESFYRILGAILPKKLLLKWKRLQHDTIRWNICDYAPMRRGIM